MSKMFLGNEFIFRAILVNDDRFLVYSLAADIFNEVSIKDVHHGVFENEEAFGFDIHTQIDFFNDLLNKHHGECLNPFLDRYSSLYIYAVIGNEDLVLKSNRKIDNRYSSEEIKYRIKAEICKVFASYVSNREELLKNNI